MSRAADIIRRATHNTASNLNCCECITIRYRPSKIIATCKFYIDKKEYVIVGDFDKLIEAGSEFEHLLVYYSAFCTACICGMLPVYAFDVAEEASGLLTHSTKREIEASAFRLLHQIYGEPNEDEVVALIVARWTDNIDEIPYFYEEVITVEV